jgi:hypothetical protein
MWRSEQSNEYLPVTPDSSVGDSEPCPTPEKPGRLIHWPGSRRDRQLAALQEGYVEMLSLMRGIREHLEKQQGVQEKMVQVLTRLPESMDGLKNVGRAAEQQVEVMSLLRQQIESGASHDRQLVESMNRFNQTLSVMDQTSRTSGRAVEQLIGKAADSEKILHDAMERSERRFMVITGIFALVAVLVAGTVLALAWVGHAASSRESVEPPPAPMSVPDVKPAAPVPIGAAEGLPPGAVPVLPTVIEATPSATADALPPDRMEPSSPPVTLPAGGVIEPPPDEKPEKPAKRSWRKARKAAREPVPVAVEEQAP